MSYRDRAWRRAQTKKIVKKRLDILKYVWGYGTPDTGTLKAQDTPGYLKKWNLTHDCQMCKINNKEAQKKLDIVKGYYVKMEDVEGEY